MPAGCRENKNWKRRSHFYKETVVDNRIQRDQIMVVFWSLWQQLENRCHQIDSIKCGMHLHATLFNWRQNGTKSKKPSSTILWTQKWVLRLTDLIKGIVFLSLISVLKMLSIFACLVFHVFVAYWIPTSGDIGIACTLNININVNKFI